MAREETKAKEKGAEFLTGEVKLSLSHQ